MANIIIHTSKNSGVFFVFFTVPFLGAEETPNRTAINKPDVSGRKCSRLVGPEVLFLSAQRSPAQLAGDLRAKRIGSAGLGRRSWNPKIIPPIWLKGIPGSFKPETGSFPSAPASFRPLFDVAPETAQLLVDTGPKKIRPN